MPQLNLLMTRRAGLACATAAFALLTFAACTTATTRDAKTGSAAEDASALVMVAEVALERGGCREAAEGYLKATTRSDDVKLAARATQVALGCEQLPTAQLAAKRWQALAPHAGEAALAAAIVAMQLHHLGEARTALTAWRDSGSAGNQDPARFAELLERETDSTIAYRVFGEVLAADDPTADVIFAQAALGLHSYDLQNAIMLAQRALEIESGLTPARLLIVRAQALLGDYDAALAGARELDGMLSGEDVFVVADVLGSADRGDQARAELLRLRANPELVLSADRRLGALALQEGDEAEAEQRFSQLLGQRGSTASALFYLAQLYERRGDPDKALTNYELLGDSSLALPARGAAARLLMRKGDRAKALGLIDEYATQHPENAIEIIGARVQVLAGAGDYKNALADLESALTRYPGHPTLEYQRATLLERSGQKLKAERAFEALLRKRTDDPSIANAYGFTLADHNTQLDRAERFIRQALAVSPDSPAIQDSLGWVLYRKGKTREAAVILERAWQHGRDAEIGAHYGEALWKLGDQGKARYIWQQALNVDPRNAAVMATQTRLTGEDLQIGTP